MNSGFPHYGFERVFWLGIGVLAVLSSAYAQSRQPVINSIRPHGTNVVVSVQVPTGTMRVTLEARERLAAGAWVPAAVSRLSGAESTVTFSLPVSKKLELLRVRADFDEPLPRDFYAGTNSFWGPQTNYSSTSTGNPFYPVSFDSGGYKTESRQVVESDIWKVQGDRLYFFNQYRGLQVVDISNPDQAFVRGLLPLSAAGDQMYLVGDTHVVLLSRQWCGVADESQIILVSVTNDPPEIVSRLPVPGYIQESRMVGSALYVSSQTYRPVPGTTNSVWQWGSLVSSFDLSNPAKPVVKDTLWQDGYGNVVAATDTFFFLVTQDSYNWWQSTVQVIDITSPDGKMSPFTTIRPAGRINDKFKMNYEGSVFTMISEDSHNTGGARVITRLETYRLPDPRSASPLGVVKLGELLLGAGEQLHATRFDSNRVYVVTFFRIDPLWVVDLSDPVKPHISGALEIPGWSTYIQPLGDRLVSVGVETNRVAVSLFNVADPAKPTLASRVLLGESYSWSEANYDEKAFTILEDAGLILVPYSGDTTNGWTSSLQLIDLKPSSLVARGIINHPTQPRRAALTKNRVLSLSGWDLLSVDATDRDTPIVRGKTTLAFGVDRLFVVGDFLVQITSSQGWWDPSVAPAVRITALANPDLILSEVPLKSIPVSAAAIRNGLLHIAQHDSGAETNVPNFYHTVINIGALPAATLAGQTSTRVDLDGWNSGWQALWPKDDLLVWAGGSSGGWFWAMDFRGGPGFYWPRPGNFFGGGHLLAVEVSKPSTPAFVSAVDLTSTNNWWTFSQSFSAGTLAYVSHSSSEPDPSDPKGNWLERHYLDVVDFADPTSPTLRKQVNIPGALRGVAENGELLYTVGNRRTTNGIGPEYLDALAYDGVAAHLVASLEISNSWPQTMLVADPSVFLGVASYPQTATNAPDHQLQTWVLGTDGKFAMQGTTKLENPASTLLLKDQLLAIQDSAGTVQAFDATKPASLVPLKTEPSFGCFWFDLNLADGNLAQGLYVPLGMYGVGRVYVAP